MKPALGSTIAASIVRDPQWGARYGAEQKIRRDDHRTPFHRDRARILHSAAFRRLQEKTQLYGTHTNDFHRTRLTHSLEVAQLGTGIVAQLKRKQPEFRTLLPSDSLIDALCLAHDIGHPPFGHGGEMALNYMMRDYGYFEGNAQTFRIVSRLEPYTQHEGMNLSRRTLLGLLKYPALLSQVHVPPATSTAMPLSATQINSQDWHPAKGIYDIDRDRFSWVIAPFSAKDQRLISALHPPSKEEADLGYQHLKTCFKSFDCSIMELADDIAYAVHDLEDAIVLGLVTDEQWQQFVIKPLFALPSSWFTQQLDALSEQLFSAHPYERKDAVGGLVNALLTAIEIVPVKGDFDSELLRFNAKLSAEMAQVLEVLKHFVREQVVNSQPIQITEYRGQQQLMALFEALKTNPCRLLPADVRFRYQQASSEMAQLRIICDHIASFTDGYAQRLYAQLFVSNTF